MSNHQPFDREESREEYRFRKDYGLAVANHLKEMQLMGLRGQDMYTVPVSIADIYIPLRVHTKETPANASKEDIEKGQDITEALLKYRRLAISGPPGSGKSTLVRALSFGLGHPQTTEVSVSLGKLLPMPVFLRKHSRHLTKVKDWQGFLKLWCREFGQDLEMELDPQRVHSFLEAGACLLMFDGVDELGTTHREKVRDKIVAPLMIDFPKNLLMVTGRPNGFDSCPYHFNSMLNQELKKSAKAFTFFLEFPEVGANLFVQPFNQADIETFSRKWFDLREKSPREREARLKTFLAALQTIPSLAELQNRPVYLTLLAIVHGANGNLPHSRAEAYREMVSAYLGQLDALRRLNEQERGAVAVIPPWHDEDKKRILEALAFELHTRGLTHDDKKDLHLEISRKELLEILQSTISHLLEHQPNFSLGKEFALDASKVLAYFESRTGLLVETSHQAYQFSHLSFQEYLTAYHLYRMMRGGEYLFDMEGFLEKEIYPRLVHNSFHETGLLFFSICALEGIGNLDALLKRLIDIAKDKPSIDGFVRFWIKLLAHRDHHLSDAYKREWGLKQLWEWSQKIQDFVTFRLLIGKEWGEPPADCDFSPSCLREEWDKSSGLKSMAGFLFMLQPHSWFCKKLVDSEWRNYFAYRDSRENKLDAIWVLLDACGFEAAFPSVRGRVPLKSWIINDWDWRYQRGQSCRNSKLERFAKVCFVPWLFGNEDPMFFPKKMQTKFLEEITSSSSNVFQLLKDVFNFSNQDSYEHFKILMLLDWDLARSRARSLELTRDLVFVLGLFRGGDKDPAFFLNIANLWARDFSPTQADYFNFYPVSPSGKKVFLTHSRSKSLGMVWHGSKNLSRTLSLGRNLANDLADYPKRSNILDKDLTMDLAMELTMDLVWDHDNFLDLKNRRQEFFKIRENFFEMLVKWRFMVTLMVENNLEVIDQRAFLDAVSSMRNPQDTFPQESGESDLLYESFMAQFKELFLDSEGTFAPMLELQPPAELFPITREKLDLAFLPDVLAFNLAIEALEKEK